MTREQMAAMLVQLKETSGNRWSLVRVVVDRQGRVLRRIFRGTFVMKDAGPRR